jgi:tetratricopeptide (TPR) repeat protein
MKRNVLGLAAAILVIWGVAGCGKMPAKLMEKAKKAETEMKFQDAVAAYEKIAKVGPKNPLAAEALYRAGLVYTNGIQNFPKAVEVFERVTAEYPTSEFTAQAQFMIGFIYANSAPDTAKARIAYKAFLEKYPQHELVPSVQWELENLCKDINEIPELQNMKNSAEAQEDAKTVKK